jgi:PhnB protein
MSVKPIPDGYHTITPYLIVEDADQLVEFIEKTFDGQLLYKMQNGSGRIAHGEIKVGNSILMLAEATEEWKSTRTMLHFYVENIDEVYQKALDVGAISIKEPKNEFYGDRIATVQDSFGNFWSIATHLEDVSPAEIEQRVKTTAN